MTFMQRDDAQSLYTKTETTMPESKSLILSLFGSGSGSRSGPAAAAGSSPFARFRLKMVLPGLGLMLLLPFCLPEQAAIAKAYHGTRLEMEDWSELIAVVEIDEPQTCQVKGTHWTYKQEAKARIITRIFGSAPAEIKILGDENFICAQAHFVKGQCLVFLKKDGDNYCGANWHYSCMPVKNGKLKWMVDPNSRELVESTLEKAISDIKEDLKTKSKKTSPGRS